MILNKEPCDCRKGRFPQYGMSFLLSRRTVLSCLKAPLCTFFLVLSVFFMPGEAESSVGLVFAGKEPCLVLSAEGLSLIREAEILDQIREFLYLGKAYSSPSENPDEVILDVMLLAWESGHKDLLIEGLSPSARWRKSCVLAELYLRDLYNTQSFSEDAIRRFHVANQVDYTTKDRVFLRHILVHQRKLVFRIILELLVGNDFQGLADLYSKDFTTASNGGNLGWFTSADMPASLEDAVFSLDPGSFYGPHPSKYGYHLIQLISKEHGRQLSFDEARDKVIEDLFMETLQQEIIRLRNKYFPEFL